MIINFTHVSICNFIEVISNVGITHLINPKGNAKLSRDKVTRISLPEDDLAAHKRRGTFSRSTVPTWLRPRRSKPTLTREARPADRPPDRPPRAACSGEKHKRGAEEASRGNAPFRLRLWEIPTPAQVSAEAHLPESGGHGAGCGVGDRLHGAPVLVFHAHPERVVLSEAGGCASVCPAGGYTSICCLCRSPKTNKSHLRNECCVEKITCHKKGLHYVLELQRFAGWSIIRWLF